MKLTETAQGDWVEPKADQRVQLLRLGRPDVPLPELPANATHAQTRAARERQMWWHSSAIKKADKAGVELGEWLKDEKRHMARWAHGRESMPEALRLELGLDAFDAEAPKTCLVTDRFGVPINPVEKAIWERETRSARAAAEDLKRQMRHSRKEHHATVLAGLYEALNPKLAKNEEEPIAVRQLRAALEKQGVPKAVIEREKAYDESTDSVRSAVSNPARRFAHKLQRGSNGGLSDFQCLEIAAYVAIQERESRSKKGRPILATIGYAVTTASNWQDNAKCVWHPSFSDMPYEDRKAAHDRYMANPTNFPAAAMRGTATVPQAKIAQVVPMPKKATPKPPQTQPNEARFDFDMAAFKRSPEGRELAEFRDKHPNADAEAFKKQAELMARYSAKSAAVASTA